MKKTLKYLALIIIWTGFYSCNRDKSNSDSISSDEAAEIIAASLSSDTGGTTAQFEDAAELSDKINDTANKEEVYDTTFTVNNRDGARIKFEYTFHYEYGIKYNSDSELFEFYANFDTDGKAESPRVSMVDNSDGSLTLTGLEQSENYYIISGSASRTGNQTISINEKKDVASTINFTFKEIKLKKSDYTIESGSGNITIVGKTSEGNDFSFTGTLIYKSDGTIILTINGEEYVIDVNSGEINSQA